MKLSVIIPVYNAHRTLFRAILSASQFFCTDTEIIVVDDGSTDGSHLVTRRRELSNANIRLIRVKNGGCSRARNIGVSESNGETLVFLDSDDFFLEPPERAFAPILADGNVQLIRAGMLEYHKSGEVRRVQPKMNLRSPFPSPPNIPGTFAVKRALFDRVGGYREELSFSENTDLLIRLNREVGQLEGPHAAVVFNKRPVLGRSLDASLREAKYSGMAAKSAEFLMRTYVVELKRDRTTLGNLWSVRSHDALNRGERARAICSATRALIARPADWTAYARVSRAIWLAGSRRSARAYEADSRL